MAIAGAPFSHPFTLLRRSAAVALLVAGLGVAAPASTTVAATLGLGPSGGCADLPAAVTAPGAARASAPVASSVVEVPRDEAPHGSPVEWWYFSGHLQGKSPTGQVRCYGFEFVTFQIRELVPVPVYLGDFAITDLSRGKFHYGAETDSYVVQPTKGSFSLHIGPWSMSGGSGRDVLKAELPGYSLRLHLQALEPAVLEGDGGAISLGSIGTSKYYSWTSLLTTGTMVDHGTDITLTGWSWMDHQWGPLDLTNGAGWDWFSVQLSNGQQYMLYFIRDHNGRIVSSFGTHVSSAGRSTRLGVVSERGTGSWRSPATGINYGSGWQLTVPEGHFDITPDLRDQELDLRTTQGNAYWEGDVSVEGSVDGKAVTGVGYTELNPPGAATLPR